MVIKVIIMTVREWVRKKKREREKMKKMREKINGRRWFGE